MSSGSLALILHTHLPFVRHPEHQEFLEEDWLFEAITESYLPLIAMMQRSIVDGMPFKLSMTFSPTLCAMLQDSLLQERYLRYLNRSIDLAVREIERNQQDEQLRKLAEFYHERLLGIKDQFASEWKGDILEAFRRFQCAGRLEIMATAATHGLLPLLQQPPEAIRAQVLIGCDSFRSTFNLDPRGFWLPECAYTSGLENVMQEANLRWFVLDAHGVILGEPRPRHAIYAPYFTAAGPAVFARDNDVSRQIWSATEGYPGDPAYRDFYRDIGFDLPADYVRPGIGAALGRRFTGLKYHRVTGLKDEKELYDPAHAERVAEKHAHHFFETTRQKLNELCELGFDPIVVAPFDTELFGHWWFEGPQFLESFIRKAGSRPQDLRLVRDENESRPPLQLTTPTEFLISHPTQQTIAPVASTWGENGYLGVWLDSTNAWIYPHLHSAARRLKDLVGRYASDDSERTNRVLQQLTRELLLAQSSDWTFLIKNGTAKHYATKRANDHLLRFNRLYEQFVCGRLAEDFLADCEWRDNLFPDVNWRYYLPC
jgi:1,4-alpha-glucan branching enzyme